LSESGSGTLFPDLSIEVDEPAAVHRRMQQAGFQTATVIFKTKDAHYLRRGTNSGS
jgi:hypothetical protein